MKVKSYAGSEERLILTGMITDVVVLGKIAARWDRDGLFASRWSNLVAGWCVRHYADYSEPPGAAVEGIFRRWADNGGADDESVKLINRFLGGLSDEYEQQAGRYGSDYLVDLAGKHFQRVALDRLIEEVRGDLERDDPDAAHAAVAGFGRIELGEGAGIDALGDQDAIRAVFEREADPLIQWPGDLERFFGGAFERDAFIAFLAPEKRGKTWAQIEVAWRAMKQRRRVAFFEIGDMSEAQIMERLVVRAARHPMAACTVRKPVAISKDAEGKVQVEFEEVPYGEPLSWGRAVKACERITRGRKSPYLMLSCHPNSSIGVDGIRSILQGWERDGWVADVVVIDYADNLEPPAGKYGDFRHGVNAVWKQLRRMSQELHCCLVTATQADAASYDRQTVGKSNFSEDKRKLAHVTGMIGLNQAKEEHDLGVIRLNWVVRREARFNEHHCISVAGCLELGRLFVLSTF